MDSLPLDFQHSLPRPFSTEPFHHLKTAISDAPDLNVFINEKRDFACLYPQPSCDYENYKPRVAKLNLTDYRKNNQVIERRFEKMRKLFSPGLSVLEIGSFDAAFLRHLQAVEPNLDFSCVETDSNVQPLYRELPWLHAFESFDAVKVKQLSFDRICFFHVLEHITQPDLFLKSCADLLCPQGKIILEVPSMDDPLLQLYKIPEYEAFYFQRQHPYVYTASSMKRLLEHHNLKVTQLIAHQRYGLENHLNWLEQRKPGGSEALRSLFRSTDPQYRLDLEKTGKTDAIIVVAEKS